MSIGIRKKENGLQIGSTPLMTLMTKKIHFVIYSLVTGKIRQLYNHG